MSDPMPLCLTSSMSEPYKNVMNAWPYIQMMSLLCPAGRWVAYCTYATVKGAGHMAPQINPRKSTIRYGHMPGITIT